MSMNSPKMGVREWMLLVLLALLWGTSFLFIEIAIETLRPFTIVLIRVALSAIALLLLIYATGQRMPRDIKRWGDFFGMGILSNFLPFSLIAWGQIEVTSGMTSILLATTPIFAVLSAHLLTRDERLTPTRIIGVLFGFVGVITLMGFDVLEGLGGQTWGKLAILCAAFSYALSAFWGRRFKDISPIVTSAGMLTTTTIAILPIALIVEQPWTASPTLGTWGAMLGLSIFGTALGYLLYFEILAKGGATSATLVTFLIPINAVLLGAYFLSERLNWTIIAGMILIFSGLIFVDGRLIHIVRRLVSKPKTMPLHSIE